MHLYRGFTVFWPLSGAFTLHICIHPFRVPTGRPFLGANSYTDVVICVLCQCLGHFGMQSGGAGVSKLMNMSLIKTWKPSIVCVTHNKMGIVMETCVFCLFSTFHLNLSLIYASWRILLEVYKNQRGIAPAWTYSATVSCICRTVPDKTLIDSRSLFCIGECFPENFSNKLLDSFGYIGPLL